MRNKWLHACAAIAVMVLPDVIATSVLAQSDTSFPSGAITDSFGALASNANVTECNEGTQIIRAIHFLNVALGTFSVRVEAAGFQTTSPEWSRPV